MNVVWEEPRQVEVIEECDVCVIGGSTTGVFAAIAAARLGARVALVENGGYFGGTATASLVCIWHSHLDTRFEREIIGGLTMETLGRLLARGGASQQQPNDSLHYILQPYELVLELDQMVTEANIRPFLHTRFVAPVVEEGRVTAAIIEDKTGRRAIAARVFVDASGDGDLVHRAGFRTYKMEGLQPPTTCAVVQGLAGIREQVPDFRLQCVFDPQYPEHLPPGLLWAAPLAGTDMTMIAGTRVHQADCSDADQLTRAELEGRRQVASMLALLRRRIPGGDGVSLHALPARIGIRQSRQACCRHRLTEQEVLHGVRFPDAIANGSYRVDVHYPDRDGLVFRYLDGREVIAHGDGSHTSGRWRESGDDVATFYQIPYRSLVPEAATNLLVAGRCLDADRGAFGAVRVMVNASQTGHAAGVAAHLAASRDCAVGEVDVAELRDLLTQQGAVIL